jgi:hypothetical protein
MGHRGHYGACTWELGFEGEARLEEWVSVKLIDTRLNQGVGVRKYDSMCSELCSPRSAPPIDPLRSPRMPQNSLISCEWAWALFARCRGDGVGRGCKVD